MRSAMDTLAVSVLPDEALELMMEEVKALVVFNPSDLVKQYTGKLLIHTLPMPDNPQYQKLYEQVLQASGVKSQAIAFNAIVAIGIVKKIRQYETPEQFAKDRELHGIEEDMMTYIVRSGYLPTERPWIIEFRDIALLDPPIYNVIPPAEIGGGDLWQGQHPRELDSFKMALDRPISIVLVDEEGNEVAETTEPEIKESVDN